MELSRKFGFIQASKFQKVNLNQLMKSRCWLFKIDLLRDWNILKLIALFNPCLPAIYD